jgi:hypothetical protein
VVGAFISKVAPAARLFDGTEGEMRWFHRLTSRPLRGVYDNSEGPRRWRQDADLGVVPCLRLHSREEYTPSHTNRPERLIHLRCAVEEAEHNVLRANVIAVGFSGGHVSETKTFLRTLR